MRRKANRTSVILLAATVCVLSPFGWGRSAFALDPKKAITQHVHDVWRVEHGLPNNGVNGVKDSSEGAPQTDDRTLLALRFMG
jgi:hypothetical protein